MTVNDLLPRWREVYEERAAIMEFDGGMTRECAEAQALADTLNEMQREKACNT